MTPHADYLALGHSDEERQSSYRSLFLAHVDDHQLKEIRDALNQGLVLGKEAFRDEIAVLTGQRTRPARRGPKPKRKSPEQEFLL